MADPRHVLRGLKGSLTRNRKAIDSFAIDAVTRSNYDTYQKNVGTIKAKVDVVNEDLLANLVDQDDLDDIEADINPVFDEIMLLQNILAEWDTELRKKESEKQEQAELKKVEAQAKILAANPTPGSSNPNNAQKPKLPTLTLPRFSGPLEEWLHFRDRFVQSVDSRTDLSDAEKLQYLIASLDGQAAEAIKPLPINNANYKPAWKQLQDQFEHTRELVYRHITCILDQPQVTAPSATSLQSLLSTTTNSLSSLETLKETPTAWDSIIVTLVTRKLDPKTRLRFHQTLPDTSMPKWIQLSSFLRKEITDLATSVETIAEVTTNNSQDQRKVTSNQQAPKTFNKILCHFCKGDHFNYKCPKLNGLQPQERKTFVEEKKACTNCLRVGHFWKKCSSTSTCRECQQKHHSLLHSAITKKKPERSSAVTLTETRPQMMKLKPTALVKISDNSGRQLDCRVLLDNCSDDSFISSSLVTRLGIPRRRLDSPQQVKALQGTGVATVHEVARVTMASRFQPNQQFFIDALIVNTIGGHYTKSPIDQKSMLHIPTDGLADANYAQPSTVSMLLATDIYHDVIQQGIIKGHKDQPIALFSSLGWLVGGGRSIGQPSNSQCNLTTCSLEQDMEKFWIIEDLQQTRRMLTAEETACQKHYEATTTRAADGSFQVRLPFKESSIQLGNSKYMALKRFGNLELKLSRNPELQKQYISAMDDLVASHHVELVPQEKLNLPESQSYFLPHHAVLKESSSTTKLRIVYDGSAKTSSGASLNDNLMVGPVLQQDLFSILVRWRWWLISLSADIKQMYLYIKIHPDDRSYLRIFWRPNQKQPIQCYQLKKVTFGTASAPYQAVRTLNQLAEEHQQELPLATEVLQRDFYVDDCLTGANSVDEAINLQKQLLSLMNKGTFILRKWTSSHSQVLESIPATLQATTNPRSINHDESTKALGLIWSSTKDEFRFELQPPRSKKITKRSILAEIARVFEPLGFLSPITIRAKLIMQMLWKADVGWDSAPPKDILQKWIEYEEEMAAIRNIRIPRCIQQPNPEMVQLHAFSDASEKAYAAVVYLRVVTASQVHVRLIASKSRVAPMKPLSLPRLELCGATMAATLVQTVSAALPPPTLPTFAWSDSTIVLAWIKGDPQRWKTFERNRVVQIQEIIPGSKWNHVPGTDNPADLPSRGISAQDLLNNNLWFCGPNFLQAPNQFPSPVASHSETPQRDVYTLSTGTEIIDTTMTLLTCTQEKLKTCDNLEKLLLKHSDWSRMRRHVAHVMRLWTWHMSPRPKPEVPTTLSALDLQRAERGIIRFLQHREYSKEIKLMSSRKPLESKSHLLSLNPFLDNLGLIRVGGILNNADLTYSRRHPLLLPRHHVTDLIARHHHTQMMHSGTQLTLAMIQRKFWICRGKSMVRQVIRSCKTCVLHQAQHPYQLMADLPASRVVPSRPFTNTGVDFAGPVILRDSYSRSNKTHKAYICVYVCFSTKAVHLEMVSSLSTEAFLASFRRFSSQRGLPSCLYSDNGTNFVGAKRELQEVMAFHLREDSQSKIATTLAELNVQWRMNPPAAPHMGGLWEAAVKSAKFHIQRVIGRTPLNFEEYSTLLKQVEACLNSRPICPASSDPNELEVLTPGHFLIGGPLLAPPEHDWTDVKVNRLSRWQRTQQLQQQFWKRWQDEYLHQLQRRSKWKVTRPNVDEGDLVVIREDHSPPQHWKLARVVEIHTSSKDQQQLVRTVTVQTKDGLQKRPITRLVLLPKDPDEQPEDSQDQPKH